jgi:hydroxyacyl-ACP dehydratase HTD2-like protein with hotdog domain
MGAEQIEVGAALPTITKTPNEVALFVFSAATWNPHRIHFERDYAHAEGHRDVVVQGSLQANWLLEALESWAPGSTLTHFTFRNAATAYVNDTFTVGGEVAEVREDDGGTVVVVDLQVEGPDGVTTRGKGTIRLAGAAA